MKTKILVLASLVGVAAMSANAGIGLNIGIGLPVVVATPPPPVIIETVPACPTVGYVWVGGFWSYRPSGYVWVHGYWGRPVCNVRGHYYHGNRRW